MVCMVIYAGFWLIVGHAVDHTLFGWRGSLVYLLWKHTFLSFFLLNSARRTFGTLCVGLQTRRFWRLYMIKYKLSPPNSSDSLGI